MLETHWVFLVSEILLSKFDPFTARPTDHREVRSTGVGREPVGLEVAGSIPKGGCSDRRDVSGKGRRQKQLVNQPAEMTAELVLCGRNGVKGWLHV